MKLKSIELNAPLSCEKEILHKFPNYNQKSSMVLMSLQKGEENLNIKFKPKKLNASDVEEIASLMSKSNPEMWKDITGESVKRLFKFERALWLGIKCEDKLVSFGYAMLTPQVSHITLIATDKQHRKKGYATSIVSTIVKKCLNKASTAIIYVMDDNSGAKNIYSKIGFKPYKAYLYLKT